MKKRGPQAVITITQVGKELHVDVQFTPGVDLTANAKNPYCHEVAGAALEAIGKKIRAHRPFRA